jgi:cell fate (sporulation/competence/biofilm development) regulator YmcA (YheA/YmcA/DUF963 family)
MTNVINMKPALDETKIQREIEAIERIQKIALEMEKYDQSKRSKMIAHTAGYLKKLILNLE